MSDQPERTSESGLPTDRPTDVARRELLRRGAKLAYVVPAVLAALSATPAFAAPKLSGGTPIGVLQRRRHDVPADLLALIAEVERGSEAA